ncbi:MAG: OmpA family protein [Bdellovibrionales bacterium]|nr:OmpA family protein [Bdellovibrionales bacterium]
MRLRIFFFATHLLFFFFPHKLQSQEFNAETYRQFSPGITEVLGIENDEYLEPGQFSLGYAGIYSYKPVNLINQTLNTEADIVRHRAFSELSMALGFRWFEVGFAIPMTHYQSGEQPSTNTIPATQETGLGDIRITLRRPFGPVEEQGFNVGASLTSEIPTAEVNYTGESKFGFIPQLMTQYRRGRFSLIGNVGGRVRLSDSALNFQIKSGLRFSLGMSYNTPIEGLGAFAHFITEISAFHKSNMPLEGTLGLRYELDPRITVLASYGKGVVSGVGAPEHRGVLMLSLQHPVKRNLRLPDERNFQPEEQAPVQELPEAPAPTQPLVFIKHGKIQTKEKIYFASAKDQILDKSIPTIKALGQKMRLTPAILKIRIEGHTDSQGGEAANLDLSQRRADSVRRALIAEGVEEQRMTAVGFGEVSPIDSNETASGRANNRRVEFVILETEWSIMQKKSSSSRHESKDEKKNDSNQNSDGGSI